MSTPSHEVGSLPPPKGDGRQSPAWWQPRRPARQGLQGNSVVGDPHHTGPRGPRASGLVSGGRFRCQPLPFAAFFFLRQKFQGGLIRPAI